NKAPAQNCFSWSFLRPRFPAELIETWPQDGSGVSLKCFPSHIPNQQPINVIEGVDDLIAFCKFLFGREFVHEPEISRDGDAICLHEGPSVSQQVNAIGDA